MTKQDLARYREACQRLRGTPLGIPIGEELLDVIAGCEAMVTEIEKQATWTTQIPITPGHYWWRKSAGHKAIMRELAADLSGHILVVLDPLCYWGGFLPNSIGGEWCGPLTPPGDEHVAECAAQGEQS